MIFSLTAALLSLTGLVKTGFYPAIIILGLLPFVPYISWAYVKRVGRVPRSLTVLNGLLILVVLWMSFVILHDRVFKDCC